MTAPVAAETWHTYLRDGGILHVDPHSNRATVTTPQGFTGPLWDGVHQLENGATVTVRSGVIVPNQAVLAMRPDESLQRPPPFVEQNSYRCELLVSKACGRTGACADTEACDLARQLLDMHREDQQRPMLRYGAFGTPGDEQCREALNDAVWFPSCGPRIGEPSACAMLVTKVCGSASRCGQREACAVARQLLGQERDERLASFDSDAATPSTGQCIAALDATDFFTACPR